MKKRVMLIVLAVVCVLVLSACGCEHEWAEANCSAPKTCSLCGETEGAPMGHSWMAATCAAPKTCEICGETQGEALEHTWADATYDAPKTCEVCGLTEGEPLASFMNSEVMDVVRESIAVSMSEFKPEYHYDEETKILYIWLTAPEGTASALLNTPEEVLESWGIISENLCSLSSIVRNAVVSDGWDVSCCIMLLNDANTENVLMSVLDGNLIYDVMSE